MKLKEKLYPNYDLKPVTRSKLAIADAMKRFRDCDDKKNPHQIKTEIQEYKKFWKCYPYEYFLGDFYRKDSPITQDEIINYIPSFFWYYLFLPYHTDYTFSSIISNKIVTEQFFQGLGIRQPKTLGIIINRTLYSPRMERCTFNQVQHEITDNLCEKIFIKPAWGGGSKGIYVFHKNESGSYTTRQNMIFEENFLGKIGEKNDYIIQAGIVQDQELSGFIPIQ